MRHRRTYYSVFMGYIKYLQDMNNFESDPEEFAKTFCKDLDIEDPEVAVSVCFSALTWDKQ